MFLLRLLLSNQSIFDRAGDQISGASGQTTPATGRGVGVESSSSYRVVDQQRKPCYPESHWRNPWDVGDELVPIPPGQIVATTSIPTRLAKLTFSARVGVTFSAVRMENSEVTVEMQMFSGWTFSEVRMEMGIFSGLHQEKSPNLWLFLG